MTQTCRVAVIAALTLIFGAISQAAEKIRWGDLQRRLTVCRSSVPCESTLAEHRIDVVTRDGIRHRNQNLTIAAERARLFGKSGEENLAREEVARIEVRQRRGRNLQWTFDVAAGSVFVAAEACSEVAPACIVGAGVVAPVMLGFAAASLPVSLVADGLSLLARPKKFEIVP